jgi:hypothetical protein
VCVVDGAKQVPGKWLVVDFLSGRKVPKTKGAVAIGSDDNVFDNI